MNSVNPSNSSTVLSSTSPDATHNYPLKTGI
jgi:hypothetical protein